MYLIYKITNKINNKIYIGLTKTGLELRWKKHLQASFSNRSDNSIFHKAIRKYGIDNFDKEILIDVILWNEDEPRTVLSRVVSKYKILYILFERFVIWKRKIKHEN